MSVSLPSAIQAALDNIQTSLNELKVDLLSPGAAPLPPPSVDTVNPPYGVLQTCMSIFALQWDGKTLDPGDNGRGAWGADTKVIQGVALPIPLLSATLGGTTVDHIKGYTVEIYSLVTQKTVALVDIVDKGPSAYTHRLIDGTFLIHKALGHIDYGNQMYGEWTPSNNHWPAGFNVAYWINDPNGKAVEIKGVDWSKSPAIILGS